MDRMTTIPSRTGSDILAISADPNSRYVRIHTQHVDEFDGDDDYWVTVGEFLAADIVQALTPPISARRHAGNKPLNLIRRRPWRRK